MKNLRAILFVISFFVFAAFTPVLGIGLWCDDLIIVQETKRNLFWAFAAILVSLWYMRHERCMYRLEKQKQELTVPSSKEEVESKT